MEHKIVNGQQVPLSAEEIAQRQQDEQAWNAGAFDRAMADLRARRNKALSDSDWTQFVDSPLTAEQKYSYAEYRQQLRDITNGLTTVEEVNAVEFPVKP